MGRNNRIRKRVTISQHGRMDNGVAALPLFKCITSTLLLARYLETISFADLLIIQWEIVHGHLKKLETLLNDTDNFKSEYRLELVTTEDKLSSDEVAPPKKSFRHLFKPSFHNETARTLQKGVNVWKRLKWAAIDKDGVSLLVNDVHRFVEDLWNMLRDEDLAFMRSSMEALMRHAISQTQGPKELSDLERLLNFKRQGDSRFEDAAIQSALSLKQRSVVLGYHENTETCSSNSFSSKPLSNSLSSATLVRPSRGSTSPRTSIATRTRNPGVALSYKFLKTEPGLGQDSNSRQVGYYDGKFVLVEWKVVDRGVETRLKYRIKTLAALLQEMSSAPFHSLTCLGYLKDPKSGNYGYIFQAPPETTKFMSLEKLLIGHTLAPSLDDRLDLAIAMTETVLQLHTAGWLHKGVRADNVIFFHQTTIDITKVYLEGYEYARADNPTDMTEAPVPDQGADLTRHPALLRANRAPFRKAFDLYGLGCLLLEIGLWERLPTILLHFSRREHDPTMTARVSQTSLIYETKEEMVRVNKSKGKLLTDTGPGSVGKALEFAAGRTFASVVRSCLSAADEKNASTSGDLGEKEEDIDPDDECIDLEIEILEKLKRCRS
ncbi:uncharacterized protein L3040_004516 [Drepanopeziza brunnea f. sp. 'multigermtubi']|uniref:uncharacterized protein n=1 Tax=Drepanopeziza brunnea f. sp. 'multigermtubi' TaxID=698441 RepID=UPI00238FEF7D|nr:hypothetical protein L3040_004516 [Drepanopeziza brunnea f. sp. 'multigermtubi']